ncbi:MAG: hypothetical protein WCI97_07185 [Bacteroidota bacterium]
MKKISLLVIMFFGISFPNTLLAQCIYGILDVPTISKGTKIIIVEIAHYDANQDKLKFLEGKTVTVGDGSLTFTFDCYYRGVVEYGGENYELADARVKTTDENAGKISTSSNSDFPMGTIVKVFDIPITDPNNPNFYSDAENDEDGFVVNADLAKDANGKFAGCIENEAGTKICFTGKKVEKKQQ